MMNNIQRLADIVSTKATVLAKNGQDSGDYTAVIGKHIEHNVDRYTKMLSKRSLTYVTPRMSCCKLPSSRQTGFSNLAIEGWMTENGAVRCLVNLGVLSAIPLLDSMSFSTLSTQLGFNQDVIERLCRYTATFGFLKETRLGQVRHTETSRLVAENLEGLGWVLNDTPFTCTRIYEALVEDPEGSEPDVCGFSVAHRESGGALESFWQRQARDSYHRKGHNALMQFSAGSSSISIAGLASKFDWNSLPAGSTVVDVGGGKGHVMLELAEHFPKLQCIVEDRRELIDGIGDSTSCSNGTTVRFVPYDFFTPQPVEAEVFFFRKVFHDWSDKYCRKLLDTHIPAMKEGALLIINDTALPDFTKSPAYAERGARMLDMTMLAYVNGKERSLEQWKTLVCSVDNRFSIQSVEAMQPGSTMSIIVFAFSG